VSETCPGRKQIRPCATGEDAQRGEWPEPSPSLGDGADRDALALHGVHAVAATLLFPKEVGEEELRV